MDHRLTADDGHEFDCWMHTPDGAPRGGIVILQEIFGVTQQLKSIAAQYAEQGYVVAIPALFDRQKPATVLGFDQGAVGRDLMMQADIADTSRDIAAAIQAVQAIAGKVAVMGFCWGGGLAIHAAQHLPVAGAVVFYGTRLPDFAGHPLRAPVQGHFGRHDDHVPMDMLDQAQAEWPELTVHLYDAGHAFANDARPSYVAAAAELAHARASDFLARVLA
ncbi:dienelactone hydrolase family protein [Roseinatronobacter sp. S2]|uniref:dienelactone hydrolase family protein n=1 Tax=Roseinatronobacter sp. S2 TaxID=3035471 RepID=UPI0024108B7B|nr:dienelactone hydrolase family protein [Roseinatronobacter sp. S2]WFE75001.1 dienelactone hydrolase family protein [Roseinatronobacter sp. S2]